MTVREQVLQAFEAALGNVTATVPEAVIERNRDIEVTSFPAVVMVDRGQSIGQDDTGIKRVRMGVDVEMYAAAPTFDQLAGALDRLYSAVVKAVLADHTLGGVAVDVAEDDMTDPEIDRAEGRGPNIAASLGFNIEYWVAEDDPDVLAP